MPHAYVEDISIPDKTTAHNKTEFLFFAKYMHGFLVGCKRADEKFLLRIIKKKNKYLIKYDKSTRIAKLDVLKHAILDLANLVSNKILEQNIGNIKESINYKNYKDADFFINHFKYDKKIWIEIGFGSGRHILYNAKNFPEILHIGIEVHKPSIEQVLKQTKLQNIDNLFVLDMDARIFLETLKENSVEKIFIHFPVPWDKASHRRVISKNFINEALKVLTISGTLELRTDSINYFKYTLELLDELKSVDMRVRKNFEAKISSKYEDRWKKQGKDIYDVIFINHQKSKKKIFDFGFEFLMPLSFDKFIKKIKEALLIKEDFLLSIKEKYTISQQEGIVKVVMGDFNSVENLYLLISKDKISYFPKKPLPITANIKAHKRLQEILL